MAEQIQAAARQRAIAANRDEYGSDYDRLSFPHPAAAAGALARRAKLLAQLAPQVEIGCGGTKLDCRDLAPGCRVCVAGGWSCLFINGRCNCRCFYCPTPQEETGLPTTNTVAFRTPADYVAYLERFGFSGASISGGEPLLTPARSLAFIAAIKRRFGADFHVWLYTNGTLLDADMAARLRDAGLDELRFDLGAAGYRLDPLRHAAGVIPTLTVEIPAVPEELERLKGLLAPLADAGVRHLNLHQLRLTPHNLPHLVGRGYTFLHGEKVTVLDSELAALELLRHSIAVGVPLPVNYCSFPYKNRYQAQAARRRNALFVGKSWEETTAAGYLRRLTLAGEPAVISRQAEAFRAAAVAPEFWSAGPGSGRLAFHPCLWPLVDLDGLRLLIAYAAARQLPAVSYHNPFTSVRLPSGAQVVVERAGVGREFELDRDQAAAFARRYLASEPTAGGGDDASLAELDAFERLPEGLQDYY